ncbi:hypothetical protein HELRODRAFT_193690 [Helobdella robusta]|uniref:MARVEL domain-containing protein n=1 Tax=Helobdella robusta TaxID=6412 RepID=T1FV94_HELRO|nr:hypothetical protein HELRODRAFT_193690 [Helobdella robusta]ESN94990.1 hypothetical protein HELRODRAFT_193690 [Helobdella robusta]
MKKNFKRENKISNNMEGIVMDSNRVGLRPDFVVTVQGILKITEIIFSILSFATASGQPDYSGLGWVVFTGVLGFILALGFFLLYFLNFYPDVLVQYKIEVIANMVLAVFYFIAGIVAAAAAGNAWFNSRIRGCAGAASFFSFFSMVLFAVDAVLLFFNQRTIPHHTTTTTSSTNSNPPPEYTSQTAVY